MELVNEQTDKQAEKGKKKKKQDFKTFDVSEKYLNERINYRDYRHFCRGGKKLKWQKQNS